MNDFQYRLNELWASKILNIAFDFSKCRLNFSLNRLENGISTQHTISISEIDFLCFEDSLHSAQREIPVFMELTGINLCKPETLVSIYYEDSDDAEKQFLRPNLIMEISDTVLLISANSIIIDGKSFSLK